MKCNFLFPLVATCFIACSTPTSVAPSPSDSVVVHIDSPTQQQAAVLRPFMKLDTLVPFSGVWVNEIYIQNIHHSRSPRQSQGVMESCINIPSRTLQVTSMISGFHEGAADMVIVKDGENYKFYSADLTLFRYDILPLQDGRIRIGDQYFIRMQQPDTTRSDWGILEEFLFGGKYVDERGQPVVFALNGQLSGLDTFAYYIPQIDYTTDAQQVDHIRLGRTARHLEDFGFRFDKDSLIIYSVNCLQYNSDEKQCDSEALGERLHTLVRLRE
jgi:hypothetical protein